MPVLTAGSACRQQVASLDRCRTACKRVACTYHGYLRSKQGSLEKYIYIRLPFMYHYEEHPKIVILYSS